LEANREDSELAKVTGALRKTMVEQFGATNIMATGQGSLNSVDEWDDYGVITTVNDELAEQKDVVACMEKAAAGLREQI